MVLTRSHRIAIVGAGPAGFFAAAFLLQETDAMIDLYDKLPTPFGLVRAGVAPDHPKIKSITAVFDRTANDPRVRFIGNVEVGVDISTTTLLRVYTAVIYAHGAPLGKTLDVPGADLPGNHTAADIVGWYNGHPDFAELDVDLTSERAVIVGNGNVALDIARTLAMDPNELATTDISDQALKALRTSKIREIVVLGRRSPRDAAFTYPELIELGHYAHVRAVPRQVEPALNDQADHTLPTRMKLETLYRYSAARASKHRCTVSLQFHSEVHAISGDTRVEMVHLKSSPQDHIAKLSAGLVVQAIGFAGSPLSGQPFDAVSGIVPNTGGRVLTTEPAFGSAYVAGWIKRGATGVIGSNRLCAKETVQTLLSDARAGLLNLDPVPQSSIDAVLAPYSTSYADWKKIDASEREAGARQNRPRVKLLTRHNLLTVAQPR